MEQFDSFLVRKGEVGLAFASGRHGITLAEACRGGTLVAPDGTVEAFCLSQLGNCKYHLTLGTASVLAVIEMIIAGIKPKFRMLSAEFTPPPCPLLPPPPRLPSPPTQQTAPAQGDYCNLVAIKFGINLPDFLFLNPAVNANCTNLFALESYCVAAVGDINTYKGRPGVASVTLDPSAPFTGIPYTESPDATGTRDDCVHYFAGDDYQYNLTGSPFASNCELAAITYDVDLESFGLWNPGLGNVSDPACAFEKGVRYCGSWYLEKANQDTATATATPTDDASNTSPTPPGPTMTGSPADCNKWSLVTDGLFCTDLAAHAGISLAHFLAWNPAVSPDCTTNYWLGEAYCVGIAGDSTSTTTTKPTTTKFTTTKPTPPATTMSGSPDNCNKWAVVTDGLSCTDMASQAGLTLKQFLAWNPAVSSGCVTNYWLGEAYCIGVNA